jgi:hypothetical protein
MLVILGFAVCWIAARLVPVGVFAFGGFFCLFACGVGLSLIWFSRVALLVCSHAALAFP